MIQIICGEDVVSSRNYLIQLKKKYLERGFETADIRPQELSMIRQWMAQNPGLFTSKRVFITMGVDRFVTRANKQLIEELKAIGSMKDTDLLIWEDKSARFLKIGKSGRLTEFKPSKTIFKLLDVCYPSNRKEFLNLLHLLLQNQDQHFIFTMLARHIRQLVLIKAGYPPSGLASWQETRLKYKARLWKLSNLILFYDGLYKIEVGEKTSSLPYSIGQALDILAVHFL